MAKRHEQLEVIGSHDWSDLLEKGGHRLYNRIIFKNIEPCTDLMSRGLRFESPIMEWAAELNGWEFQPLDTKYFTIKAGGREITCRSTADFIVNHKENPEVKTIVDVKCHDGGQRGQYGAEFSDVCPYYIWIQAQAHCHAYDVNQVALVAQFLGWGSKEIRPEVFYVERDREFFELAMHEMTRFHVEHIWPEILPEPDDSDDCSYLLKNIPASEGEKTPSKRIARTVGAFHRQATRIRSAEKKNQNRKNKIRHYMGESTKMICSGVGPSGSDLVITWAEDKRGRRSLRTKEKTQALKRETA